MINFMRGFLKEKLPKLCLEKEITLFRTGHTEMSMILDWLYPS